MPYSRILITAEQLEQIVSSLSTRINAAYQQTDNCLALVVLNGAKYFARDLLAKLNFPFEVEAIKASSYSGHHSTGQVSIDTKNALKEKIRGKDILLIDDIYDTGLTLSRILDWLSDCHPNTMTTCVLLEKKIKHTQAIDIDFLGTTIEDVFAIGYGLDFNEQYRELPFIGELSADIMKQNDPACNPSL